MSSHNSGRRGTVQGVHRTIVWLLASGAWAAGLWGALQLQRLPTSVLGEHVLCGPWGCGPPVPALLACHGFWMVLLGPPAVLAALRLPSRWVGLLGMLLVLIGAAGLLGVAAYEAATWFRGASEWQRQYAAQRYFYALVMLVDFPILEVLIVGSGLWWAYRAKAGRAATPVSLMPDGPHRVELPGSRADLDSV